MDIATLQSVLLWCTLINYAFLVFWALLLILPRGWLYRISGRLYRISPEQFDTLNFAGIVFYKIMIFMFNLVPYLALVIAS
jgi:hypothetical protein